MLIDMTFCFSVVTVFDYFDQDVWTRQASQKRFNGTVWEHLLPITLCPCVTLCFRFCVTPALCILYSYEKEVGGEIIILFIFQVHLNPSFNILLMKISLKIPYVKQSTSLKFGVIIKKFMVGTHRFSIRYTAVESSIMDRKLMGSDDARNFASG